MKFSRYNSNIKLFHTSDSQMIIYDDNPTNTDDTIKNFNNVNPDCLPQRKRTAKQ
jgi:hypothetical protein